LKPAARSDLIDHPHPSQRERLEGFCKVQEDWHIVAHHEDRATGTKLERPGLQAALNLARQGKIDQLLVSASTDSAARSASSPASPRSLTSSV
jgi:DNA invertase Pin-like site-specific DNA recombinase